MGNCGNKQMLVSQKYVEPGEDKTCHPQGGSFCLKEYEMNFKRRKTDPVLSFMEMIEGRQRSNSEGSTNASNKPYSSSPQDADKRSSSTKTSIKIMG